MALKDFMARGERGIETTTTNASAPKVEPPRPTLAASPAPRTVAPSTSVDASTELEGRLRCKETLRIDGQIKGEIECDKTVLVGEGARVLASITADEVQIAGIVEGDIIARRKITLARTAAVKGDLTTPGIVIEEGAKLQGRIVIGSDAEPATAAKTEPKPAAKMDEKIDEKKTQPSRKPTTGGPKSDAPSSQPVAASA